MIFWFSGTGNSLWVARRLQEAFGGDMVQVAEDMKSGRAASPYRLAEGELVFFVFPVHSWGPAPLMLSFISRLAFEGRVPDKVYGVCTCGDNCGYTGRMLEKALSRRSLPLSACWSVRMPNNFILMKGFGVDTGEVASLKLSEAPAVVDSIISAIRGSRDYVHYETGTKPFLKSRIVYPLFSRFVVGSRSRFTVSDSCIGCGLCAKSCPAGIISMDKGRPVWERKGCLQCTACINRCPVRAIEYGEVTQQQGRYVHPDLRKAGQNA